MPARAGPDSNRARCWPVIRAIRPSDRGCPAVVQGIGLWRAKQVRALIVCLKFHHRGPIPVKPRDPAGRGDLALAAAAAWVQNPWRISCCHRHPESSPASSATASPAIQGPLRSGNGRRRINADTPRRQQRGSRRFTSGMPPRHENNWPQGGGYRNGGPASPIGVGARRCSVQRIRLKQHRAPGSKVGGELVRAGAQARQKHRQAQPANRQVEAPPAQWIKQGPWRRTSQLGQARFGAARPRGSP